MDPLKVRPAAAFKPKFIIRRSRRIEDFFWNPMAPGMQCVSHHARLAPLNGGRFLFSPPLLLLLSQESRTERAYRHPAMASRLNNPPVRGPWSAGRMGIRTALGMPLCYLMSAPRWAAVGFLGLSPTRPFGIGTQPSALFGCRFALLRDLSVRDVPHQPTTTGEGRRGAVNPVRRPPHRCRGPGL